MKRVYKISILFCLIAVIMLIGRFALAQNKGYFYEKDREFFLLGNLQINGYLAVEKKLSGNEGLFGDVLVGENLSLDINSAVNFCKDVGGKNQDCSEKIMIWQPNGLEVIDLNYYEIQAQKLLANNSNIFFLANKAISTNSTTRINGCLANDGTEVCNQGFICSGTGPQTGNACNPNVGCPKGFCNILNRRCVGPTYDTLDPPECNPDQDCPGGTCNLGEVKTGTLFLDNINSLASKTNNVIDTITLAPKILKLRELNLGGTGETTLENITINGDKTVRQIDLQNLCWDAGDSNGVLKYPADFSENTALCGINPNAAFGAYPLAHWNGPYLCCNLDISLEE